MTGPEYPPEYLAPVLRASTDLLEPDAGKLDPSAVWAQARRRRGRKRAAAVGLAAAVVAVVIVIGQFAVRGTDGRVQPAAPSPTTDPAPVGETWDPFTIAEQPRLGSALPSELVPPSHATPIADDPMPAAVVAWPREGADLLLLGTDGRWRSVPGTGDVVSGTLSDVVRPALTGDGSLVAMSVDEGVLVVDVTTGGERLLPWSGPLAEPQDVLPSLEWAPDRSELAVLHWKDIWFLRMDGSLRRAGFASSYGTGFSYDSDGSVLMRQWRSQAIVRYRDGREVGRAPFALWGSTRAVADDGRIAFAGGGSDLPGDGGPVVVDAESGEILAYRPIRDRSSVYTDNGHLRPVGFWDADTVVLLVAPTDFRTMEVGEETWHLVVWDLAEDRFARLTQGDAGLGGASIAVDALGIAAP